MFKGKLIEASDYYSIRKKLIWISLSATAIMGIIYGYSMANLAFLYVYALAMIIILFIQIRLRKKMTSFSDNRRIEISNDKICVFNNNGNLEKEILVADAREIKIANNYHLSEEGFKEVVASLKGKPLKNQISIQTNNETEKFDFIVDSHYRVKKLQNVIDFWNTQNINVSTISN